MDGPSIPSDRRWQRGSIVHYRYGGFDGQLLIQQSDGNVIPAIYDPDGKVVPDERRDSFAPPTWVVNPFPPHSSAESCDQTEELDPAIIWRHRNIRAVGTLAATGRGAVLLGIDVRARRRCVIKTVAGGHRFGHAAEALHHEASIIERISGDDRWPEFVELIDDPGVLALVMSDLAGQSMSDCMSARAEEGRLPTDTEIRALGTELATIVGRLHALGIVHRDLKSANVLIDDDGTTLRLIDFELAASIGKAARPGGTRGYLAPEAGGDVAAISEDIYAVGALLYLIATGAEPSHAPDAADLLTRPCRLLNPSCSEEVSALIVRCLNPEPNGRPATMDEIVQALATNTTPNPAPLRLANGPRDSAQPCPATSGALLTASRMLDAIADEAVPAADGGAYWTSTAPQSLPIPYRQINNGVPRILLALAAGVLETTDARHRDVLRRGAHWLAGTTPLPGAQVSGLYSGEAGVLVALTAAANVLDDEGLREAALTVERRLASYPFASDDLYNGTAGRARALLACASSDLSPSAHLQACADRLHAGAHRLTTSAGEQHAWWDIPVGTSGETYAETGYAHGAAGIADVLLDLYAATGDRDHLDLALAAGRWIAVNAVDSLADGSGVDWGHDGGFSGLWCYGASGVGAFLLRLSAMAADDDLLRLALRAGRAAARAGRHSGPNQCHGLAGCIEYLLDLYQATGDDSWLDEADQLLTLLDAFREEQDGRVRYPSRKHEAADISFMTGDAGLVALWLRLANPATGRRLMTTAGLRQICTATMRG